MPQVVDNKTNVSNENHKKYMGRSHKSGLLDVSRNPIITWNQKVENTELEKFQNLIEKKYKKCFASYWDFHKWSIENYVTFWEEIWHFFDVICSKSYDKVFVKTGPGFLDNEWFSGARFNFAENMLRFRDDRIALMYIDVSGNEESVTFAEMFEEVKLYAAAFRKKWIEKGRCCSLVFLEDFLKDGRNPDGTVPDIIFEQLPFSHPICINFTSGTTGLPKAPIHSAGTLISHFRDLGIHLNLKTGDTVAQMYSVGWAVWDYFIPTLALGIKYFLYCSSVFCKFNGKTFWDMMAKYNVKFTLMATSCVEYMEKMGIVPSPGTNLDCLEIVGVGSSPVKKESFEYLQNRVKKDLFIVSLYGATEVFGAFAGCNLNMPVYAGEIQTFSLGTDVKCFDEAGKSVIGEKGELVVCTPSPAFPTGLWKDENNIRLHEAYLSKYEGVWCQNDYCWINPKTKGLIVIGRSDDTIIQNDERFSAGVIYFAIHSLKELVDYICVGQHRDNGDSRAVLFVKMQKGYTLTSEMKSKIEKCIEKELNVDFIPECIVEVPEIPYNINNKRMESVVRKIVAKNEIPEVMNIKNPESLKHFLNIPEVMCYNEI